ncbi:MAG: DNA adenine methylase [Pseudonocardia sp.]
MRYPGAKSGLAPLIGTLIRAAASHPRIGNIDLLVEPFAGGASTSLRLVGDGTVDRILLADGDPLVAAFWQIAAQQPQQLISRMRDEHAEYVQHGGSSALARWDYWRQWQPRPGQRPATTRFESAVKCLFLNRTTFSGILHGRAGPIGGRRQESPYPIGCRYNPETLADRISYVGHLYSTHRLVDVWCADWRTTLQEVASAYKALVPNRVVAYLDPPYIEKSTKLYSVSFDPAGSSQRQFPHERLAEHLVQRMRYRWVLSYDAHPALLDSPMLYARNRMDPSPEDKGDGVRQWRISKRIVELSYSASASRSRWNSPELLLTTLPRSIIPVDKSFAMPQAPGEPARPSLSEEH